MKKLLWSLFIVSLLSLCLLAASAEEGQIGDNVFFSLDANGVLTISGTGDMWDFEYDSSPFAENDDIRSVIIESGATGIGDYAFDRCVNLESISLPAGMTGIGKSAFSGCSGLTSIALPDGMTGIGETAFMGCSALSSVSFPESLTDIGEYAFDSCSALGSVTLPTGMTVIRFGAFIGCSGLSSIAIPEGVDCIEEMAFWGCSTLSRIDFTGNAPEIQTNAFGSVTATVYYPANDASWTQELRADYGGALTWTPYGSCAEHAPARGEIVPATRGGSGSIGATTCANCAEELSPAIVISHALILPEELMQIEAEAFAGASMQQVTIPDGATRIGAGAFANCKSLRLAIIPASVTDIADSAFSGCGDLIILCKQGSAAQRFADESGILYDLI